LLASKVNSRNHGYQKTLDWIQRSLENLQMDYIDLFLIHDPLSGKEKRIETWKALIKARDDGKLKSIGVSN
jgi:diketogulonate reductase-like aldo/keto reductase